MTADKRPDAVLPPGLRERVMAASHHARRAGVTVPEISPDSPTGAFGRAADSLFQTLNLLSHDDWHRHVLRDLDVQGLVGHLIGVEHDVLRGMSGDPEVASANHVESTQPAALAQAGRAPSATAAEWREAVDTTLSMAAESDLDAGVAIYCVALRLRDLLVARTFELWTHENDIRAIADLEPSVPEPSTLVPMTELATALLPFGAAATNLHEPMSVHLVLTGPGGGTWDVTVGDPSPDSAEVGIVTDAVGFCRLVANRVSPSDLDVLVTGDARLATSVLTAAAALALD
jgi:hypothetical protein